MDLVYTRVHTFVYSASLRKYDTSEMIFLKKKMVIVCKLFSDKINKFSTYALVQLFQLLSENNFIGMKIPIISQDPSNYDLRQSQLLRSSYLNDRNIYLTSSGSLFYWHLIIM